MGIRRCLLLTFRSVFETWVMSVSAQVGCSFKKKLELTFHVQKNQSPNESMLASENCFKPALVASDQFVESSQSAQFPP